MEWDTPEDVIRPHLNDGERLVWCGKPLAGMKLRLYDAFMIPFSILWCGFAVFWEMMVLGMVFFNANEQPPETFVAVVFPLFGLPFVIIGLYMLFGRFMVDARQRKRTYYAITDSRVLIVSGLFSRKLKSLNLRTLSDISMSEKSDGSGYITFGPTYPFMAFLGGAAWGSMYALPSFDLLPDVAKVYRIICDAQKKK